MAHFRATVCLAAPDAHEDLEGALRTALAPFEIGVGPEETWMWDGWWIRGGSDESGFLTRQGYEGDSRLIHDPPLWDGTALLSMPGWCAGGPRALLDFETPIREATIRAEAQWAAWAQAARGCPPAVPHEEFWARHRADPDEYPYPQVRQDYLAQPLVQALAALEGHQPVPFFPNAHMIWSADPVVLIARGRSEFVRRAASRVISRAALLTLDGRWLDEDGGTGYADPPEPPESGLNLADEYAIECTDYLLGLAPETVVVRIRCHC